MDEPGKGKPARVPAGTLQETVTARGHAALVRSVAYTRLAGNATARTIDDVPLGALGIQKTLHLTLAVSGQTARVEHALLSPDAIVLK